MRAHWITYCALAGTLFAAACTGSAEDGDDGGSEGGAGGGGGGGGGAGGGGGGGAGGGSGGGSGSGGGGGDSVPSGDYCDSVTSWPSARVTAENEILALVNAQRAKGATCGDETFGPAAPLEMDPALRCAARVHTVDMAENDFFNHTNPAGEAPWDRMENAGYAWGGAGENIAGGSSTAKGSMEQWMGSPGHCSNIMNPGFKHIGVGFVDGANLWTQVFASPR